MSILNKTTSELTVKDSLKINGMVLGIIALPYVAIYSYAVVKDKVRQKRAAKLNTLD